MTRDRGAGNSDALLIMGIVAYFVFMGMYANSLGYHVTGSVGELGSWTLPYLHYASNGAWYWLPWAGAVTIVDVAVGVLNILGWVLQCLASYGALLGFGVTGNMPVWITTVLFIPVMFTFGYIILVLVRG